MNREIKFRGKSLIDGSWVEGSLVEERNGGLDEGRYIMTRFANVANYEIVPVDPLTVCQYTGMKDSKGKEVWEHDIIKTFEGVLYEVTYKNCGFVLLSISAKEIKESPFSMWITLSGHLDFWDKGSKFDKEM